MVYGDTCVFSPNQQFNRWIQDPLPESPIKACALYLACFTIMNELFQSHAMITSKAASENKATFSFFMIVVHRGNPRSNPNQYS